MPGIVLNWMCGIWLPNTLAIVFHYLVTVFRILHLYTLLSIVSLFTLPFILIVTIHCGNVIRRFFNLNVFLFQFKSNP